MISQRIRRMTWLDIGCYATVFVLTLLFLYPVVYSFSVSISDPASILVSPVMLWPSGFSLEAYSYLLENPKILMYYKNSVIYTVLATLVFLVFTSMMAFPFIVKEFRGKKILNIYMVITMFFGGGLIPTYYVINMLGLRDTIWVMVLPGCVSAYTVIIFRTFFLSIPTSLSEAAYIDGAGHYRVLAQVIIPLSKPLLATFALFTAVGKWNDWFSALIYLSNDDLQTMQIFLRKMLITNTTAGVTNMNELVNNANRNPMTIKYASVWVTILPIMCIYPFLQKYFAQGMMIGAIKG
jgi:putative aldouronate transport system permease protein